MTSIVIITHTLLCNDNLPSVYGAYMKPIWKYILFSHRDGIKIIKK